MHCKNCSHQLNEATNYCPQCGARVIRNRLTPKVLVEQINEEVLSLDNKFLLTFLDLIKRPENVINGFNNGLRKRYLNVITYYAISLSVLGLQLYILQLFAPEMLENQSEMFGNGFQGSEANSETFNPQLIGEYVTKYQNILFTVLMPFIAVGTWIVYLDKKTYNYTEHLVINLYLNAQWIMFGFFLYIGMAMFDIKDYLLASLIATPLSILYGGYVFKRLFNTGFFNAVLRYIGAFIIYMFVFSIILIIIFIILIIYLLVTGKLS